MCMHCWQVGSSFHLNFSLLNFYLYNWLRLLSQTWLGKCNSNCLMSNIFRVWSIIFWLFSELLDCLFWYPLNSNAHFCTPGFWRLWHSMLKYVLFISESLGSEGWNAHFWIPGFWRMKCSFLNPWVLKYVLFISESLGSEGWNAHFWIPGFWRMKFSFLNPWVLKDEMHTSESLGSEGWNVYFWFPWCLRL